MKRIKLLFWIEAILCIALWAYMLFRPDLALTTVILIFAIYCIVSGIAGFVFTIKENDYQDRYLLWIIFAFVTIFGLLLLCFPKIWETIVKVLVAVLWISVIVKWVFLMFDSFSIKKMQVTNWYRMFILSVILILFWLFLALNSFVSIIIVQSLIWICLIGVWIAMIIWSFKLKKIVKEVKKELDNVESVEVEIKW